MVVKSSLAKMLADIQAKLVGKEEILALSDGEKK